MRQVVSYIRVSTASKARAAWASRRSAPRIARFIEAEGCEVLAEYRRGGDGQGRRRTGPPAATRRRPGNARKAKAAVVVAKLDRLSPRRGISYRA